MSIIRTVPDDEATGRLAELYADDIADQGFVAAHTRVMGLHPEAYDAWEALITAIGRPMGKRRYELVTLAAARGARSDTADSPTGAAPSLSRCSTRTS